MTDENTKTLPRPSTGYVMTRPPSDPYVAAVVFVLLFIVSRFGKLPEGVDDATVHAAVEGIFGGGAVIASVLAELWRRRVRHGNRLS